MQVVEPHIDKGTRYNRFIRIVLFFLVFSLFFLVFIRYLYPISSGRDTDIFWHIKTGEIISHEYDLPVSDPFTYTPKEPLREKILLQSYWLADVFLYAVYNAFGFPGLVFLRSLVLCSAIFVVFLGIIRKGFFAAVGASLILAFVLMPTSTLRPNLFSFFFAAAMIFLVERYREIPKTKYRIGLWVVMLLWSNMHAGYVVGAGILFIYIVAGIVESLPPFRAGNELRKSAGLFVTAGGGITAAFFNPLGIYPFLYLWEESFNPARSLLTSSIETEMGMLKVIRQNPSEMIFLSLIVVGYILISTALILTRRKRGLTEAIIVVTLLLFSLITVRIMPLFMIIGLMVSAGKSKDGRTALTMKPAAVAALSFTLLALIYFFVWRDFPRGDPGRLPETDTIYPRAGSFLEINTIQGNMLNPELVGNYIIFRLFPKYRVFTDTRYISMKVFFDSLDLFYAVKEPSQKKESVYADSIASAYMEHFTGGSNANYAKEYWYGLLKRYEIDFIVSRVTHPKSGYIYPLMLKLMNDDVWKLIYMDGNVVILILDNGKNEAMLRQYPHLDKRLLYDQAIQENTGKHSSHSYQTVGFASLMKGDMQNAEKYLGSALSLNQNLNVARAGLQIIKKRQQKE